MITLAMIMDLLIRDPKSKYHPIALIGNIIIYIEKIMFKDSKIIGILFFSIVQLIVLLSSLLIEKYLLHSLQSVLIFLALSSASLRYALKDIRIPLQKEMLEESRICLSMIVTRRTNKMSKKEIILSTLESGAENFADGIIGPYFYLLIGMMIDHPLLLLYFFKTSSTLDSMAGYKNEKYNKFGFLSAKVDDILMYIPARVSIVFLLIGSMILRLDIKKGMKTLFRDSHKTDSPNSGITESFIAGVLGCRFGGRVDYGGVILNNPIIGDAEVEVNNGLILKMERLIFIGAFLVIGGIYLGQIFFFNPW